MAARGAESKAKIIEKILTTFEDSFQYDKEVRIPMYENGELIQIKLTLTAAKTNVENETKSSFHAAIDNKGDNKEENIISSLVEPTDEEKRTLEDLMSKLGLEL